MARSLTVKHEEKSGTSMLLNTFLVLVASWMVVGAVLASIAEESSAPSDPVAPIDHP